jgi:hypothetical protein
MGEEAVHDLVLGRGAPGAVHVVTPQPVRAGRQSFGPHEGAQRGGVGRVDAFVVPKAKDPVGREVGGPVEKAVVPAAGILGCDDGVAAETDLVEQVGQALAAVTDEQQADDARCADGRRA